MRVLYLFKRSLGEKLRKLFSPKYRTYLKNLEMQAEIERSERMLQLNLDPTKSIKKADEKGW